MLHSALTCNLLFGSFSLVDCFSLPLHSHTPFFFFVLSAHFGPGPHTVYAAACQTQPLQTHVPGK